MTAFKPSAKSKVVRIPNRGHYDKQSIYELLDRNFICHVSYVYNNTPVIIPTAYARVGNDIYLHGAIKNRMLNSILDQDQICLAVTELDGLVLARSAFHHSMNYYSVVIFGQAEAVDDEGGKIAALHQITENILKGRWDEARKPSQAELKATLVIKITIQEASLKKREGPPVDNEEDYSLPIWAGVLPITTSYATVQPDPAMSIGHEIPPSVINVLDKKST